MCYMLDFRSIRPILACSLAHHCNHLQLDILRRRRRRCCRRRGSASILGNLCSVRSASTRLNKLHKVLNAPGQGADHDADALCVDADRVTVGNVANEACERETLVTY